MRPFLDRLKPLQGDGSVCSHEFFQAICQAYSIAALGDKSAELPAVEVVGARPEAVDNDLPADPTFPQPWHLNLVHNWAELQRNDPSLAKVLRYLRGGQPPAGCELKKENAEVVQLIREWDRLAIRDNVLLCRRLTNGHETFQLILPAEFFMGIPHPRPESYKSRQTPVGKDFHQLRNAPTFALRPGS